MGLLDTLGPVLGMQPTPQPPQPPSDLMQQLMSLGSVDQRHKLLQSQFDLGGQLAQGAPVDYAHGKGTPLLLSGLANLFSAGVGGYQQGKATGGLRDLVTQTDAGLKAGVDLGSQWKPPDIAGVQTATDADLPAKTQAAQDSIGTGRRFAMAIAASGNPQLAAIGKSIMSQADEGQQALQGMPRTRNELQMSAIDIAKRLRGAAVETSPVVSAADTALIKEMGYSVPDGASPGEIAAILTQAQKQYAEKTERAKVSKFGINPVTGRAYDTRTGQDVVGSGGAGAPTNDKRFSKMQTDLEADLDPNKSRSGTLKGNQERLNAAQRLLTLAVDPLTGGPANLTPQQMTEVSGSLATLIGGGSSGEGTRHDLTPYTSGRSLSDVLQWVTNEPHGASQQAFVKQMIDTAKREQGTASTAIRQAQAQRLSSHLQYLQLFPDQAKAQLESYGFDPTEVDFKTGKYTPKGAPSASPAQAPGGALQRKTIVGKTYEKRPDGWYEVTDGQ